VTERDILRRARAAGISPTYENWRHEQVEVSPDTLEALLAALDRTAPAGAPAAVPARATVTEEPRIPALPATRTWGFTVQLYSIRSRQSWGHGDLHDLGELAAWSAREHGAGFVLVNPLHAAEPAPPISPSPYLPTTRMFTSPLYLRVEDIEEYRQLDPVDLATVEVLAKPLQDRSGTPELIDRNAVWQAKRAALELVSRVELSPQRQAQFDRYRAERDPELRHWSAWCALAEENGPDWRSWPAKYSSPAQGLAAVSAEPELRDRAAFHCWLQWQCEQQLAQAQLRARQAGMQHGIIHDLAVGVQAGGADAWAHPELLVAGVSVGAPPDSFNQLGQDWGMPPWHPRQLAAAGYRPLADLFGASLRHAGGLRVDHVMGLTRLWWVPAGRRPDQGAYVSYDPEASVGALAGTAARHGAIAIGEDLGTVDPWVRTHLADHHILGTMMLWFASRPDGTPLPPARWRRACMATVGTHDVPPVAGFVTGDQVTVRAGLGLLNMPLDRERAQARLTLERWRAALVSEGLLPPGAPPDPAEFTVAMYGFLSRTPSLLAGVSLADAVGDVRTQNIPGTSAEYPNWRIPLCDAAGSAVLLEDLGQSRLLADTVTAVQGAGRPGAVQGRPGGRAS
jgi:4-alpha-glucanotransferase